MRRWRRPAATVVFLAALAGVATAAVVLEGGTQTGPPARPPASAWQGLVGGVRPSVALGQRVIVLLEAPSLAERVRRAGGVVTDATQRRWTSAALASQQQFLAELAEKGVLARPELRFTRVVNGFSAIADPSAVALLEQSPRVGGVFPVRAAFPALARASVGQAEAAPIVAGLASFPGKGVTVALLDTAVDPATPYLHGRVLPGFDAVSGGVAARYDQRPGGARLETHGTTMAGTIVGLGGPGRPSGAAPAATLLPIRVAGWQRDAVGRWSIHARTDQVIAGLEHAVDPDRDGDAHDAARVTVVPLVEPFAAFSEGPLAQAVEGATALDSLVIAPAGNDGPGGPAFGSIAGPGGAPGALTIGAVDLQPAIRRVPALVRSGLRVLGRGPLELLTAAAPPSGTIELVPVGNERDLFARGRSRVAGRGAMFTAPVAPRQAAERAAAAGATLVVLAGGELPPGALGLEPGLTASVLTASRGLAEAVVAERTAGREVWLSTASSRETTSPGRGRPAPFSSWGLAFGGQLKPDASAPGVGITSALPGADEDGRSRLVTISGGSAAAAVAAGIAARLAQARPGLNAAGLRSALVGTAYARGSGSPLARGMGVLDGARAAEVEVVAAPATVSFGRGSGDGWRGRRSLVLRNVSTRTLTVYLAASASDRGVALRLSRRRLKLAAGGTASIWMTVRVLRVTGAAIASGIVRVAPRGSRMLQVPWTLVLAPPPDDLIADARLSARRFAPSDLTPAVLTVRLGTIARRSARDVIEPVRRFDVVLENERRRPLGLLLRLRDVLPGRYALGITGRGPDGRSLRPGDYVLRLAAWPAAGGRAVVDTIRFSVE